MQGNKTLQPFASYTEGFGVFFCRIFLLWSGLLFHASIPLFLNGNDCCHCVYWYCVSVSILFFYFIWANSYIA